MELPPDLTLPARRPWPKRLPFPLPLLQAYRRSFHLQHFPHLLPLRGAPPSTLVLCPSQRPPSLLPGPTTASFVL